MTRSALPHVRRNRETDLLGGLQVDDHFEITGGFDGQILWFGAFENAIYVQAPRCSNRYVSEPV